MATIITRETGATAKNSPLTNAELDANFVNLNTAKLEIADLVAGRNVDVITASGKTTVSSKGTVEFDSLTSTNIFTPSLNADNSVLNGINSAALHRSPNAVTAMFVYDTSKDSDGGAWTEKCQHTSWYNEALNGKWLGAWGSESLARTLANATLGSELITNGTFSTGTTAGWTPRNGGTNTVNASNQLVISGDAYAAAEQTFSTVVGKTYVFKVNLISVTGTTLRVQIGLATGQQQYLFTGLSVGENIFTFVATATTAYLTLQNGGAPGTCVADNVSVREVAQINTASGDYYQSTVDGKFYRLWKNLLASSRDPFTIPGGVISKADAGTNAPTGDQYVRITELSGTNTGKRFFSQQIATQAGKNNLSLYVTEGSGGRLMSFRENSTSGFAFNFQPSTGIVSNYAGGASASNVLVQNLGAGVYRVECSIEFTSAASRNFSIDMNNGSTAQYAGDGVSGFNVTSVQFEYSSTATTYERKTADGSVTETFRGNKADFPRLAGIVAEAANVTIYDLTEAGRPMWMRFIGVANQNTFIGWNVTAVSSVFALNGVMAVGAAASNLSVNNFARDFCRAHATLAGGTSYIFNGGISTRNATPKTSTSELYWTAIPSSIINAVAMTVLPDAPVDAVTGLQVPTIAVATAGGVSVIKHNGTVVNSAKTGAAKKVNFGTKGFVLAGFEYDTLYVTSTTVGALGGSFAFAAMNSGLDVFKGGYGGGVTWNTQFKDITINRNALPGLVKSICQNYSKNIASITTNISDRFNDGYSCGLVRRSLLASTVAGSLTKSANLVPNPDFTTTASWSLNAGWSIDTANGLLVGTNASSIAILPYGAIGPYSALVVEIVVSSYTSGSVKLAFGELGSIPSISSAGTHYRYLTGLAGNEFYLSGTNFTGSIDSIRAYRVDADWSIKQSAVDVVGTLTKTQVAAASQLVAYSGFSAANYLREPYSADLDFGTGEWSASAWVNVPVTTRYNLLTKTEQFDDAVWVKNGITVIANQTIAPDGTTTADTLNEETTNGYHNIGGFISSLAIGTYTQSVCVKDIDGRYIGVTMVKDASIFVSAIFDLSSGTVSTTSLLGAFFSNLSASIDTLPNGWYRFSITYTTSLASRVDYGFYMTDIPVIANNRYGATAAYTGTDRKVFIWGASLVLSNQSTLPYQRVNTGTDYDGSTATVAERAFSTGPRVQLGVVEGSKLTATAFDGTTTRTVTTTAAYNTGTMINPVVTYTTDGTLAIRVNGIEVAATRGTPLLSLNSRYNLLTYTEDFANAAWNKANTTVSGTKYAAPNGTVTADLLLETATSGTHGVNRTIASIDAITTPYTSSLYVKGSGRTKGDILFSSETSPNPSIKGVFDLVANSFTITTGGAAICTSSSITPLSDGWYKISFTGYTGASGTHSFRSLIYDDSGNVSYTGDVAKGVYIWGADLRLAALASLPYQRVNTVTDFDGAAPLTIGNSFAADAPFPGSISLLKLSATVPTAEQSVWMYEQEKQMFRDGAQVCLPDAGSIVDLAYDDATDKWLAVSATNESEWSGLVRTSVTASPAGSYSKITASSGVQMQARTTTNPGVDITVPAYNMREELVRRSESAAKLSKAIVVYDYVGGFTATTVLNSTAITSVAGVSYPVSYIGARVTGTGIPTDTFVSAVSGTTIYLSKLATAAGTAVQIAFTDFILPVGYTAKMVSINGSEKQESSTKDWTRLYDGFKETIRMGVAPSVTAWIQIQAVKEN